MGERDRRKGKKKQHGPKINKTAGEFCFRSHCPGKGQEEPTRFEAKHVVAKRSKTAGKKKTTTLLPGRRNYKKKQYDLKRTT